MKKSLEASFWEKVNKDGPLPAHRPELGNCWLWTKGASVRGSISYGRFQGEYAHRVAMRLSGHEPSKLHVDHLCRVTLCVRPTHLEYVTQQENNRRQPHSRQSHCKRGHELIDGNLYYDKHGYRGCRACALLRAKLFKQAKKFKEPAL